MKRKYTKLLIILITIIISSSSALATNYKEWDLESVEGYEIDKTWTIKFSHNVEESSISDSSIYIKDSSENIIPTSKKLIDNTLIEIKPIDDYEFGKTYILYIEDTLKSSEDKIIINPMKMKFRIKNNPIKENINSFLTEALRKGETNLDISDYEIKSSEINSIIQKIVLEDPLILYYNGFGYSFNNTTKVITELRPKYKIEPELIEDKLIEVQQEADRIFDDVLNLENKTQYEQILEVHDYLVKNIVYAKGFNNGSLEPDQFSMYGALVENSSVCEGYSESFLYFMNKLNIESKQIIGTGNNVSHAWNLVKLDGDWYHVDVTFDDPIPDKGDEVQHKYLLITDSRISTNHSWDKSDYESANGTANYYFTKENLEINSVSEFKTKIKSLYQNNISSMEIWCNPFNKNVYTVDLISKALGEAGNRNSFNYSIDDKLGIVNITTK